MFNSFENVDMNRRQAYSEDGIRSGVLRMAKVSASILSADWLRLGAELKRAQEAGCDCIHIDVTDGHFVSNLTMGMDITRAVSGFTQLRVDAHLMIAEPGRFIEAFAGAGADSITFHAEARRRILSN